MAKITKHGGPSDRLVEIDGPMQHPLSRRPQIGMVKSSQRAVGKPSEASSETDETRKSEQSQTPQPPAQTTENPSSPPEGESSGASLTGGSGPETEKAPSAKKSTAAKKSAPAKKANPRTRSADGEDEFDEPVDLSGHDEFE